MLQVTPLPTNGTVGMDVAGGVDSQTFDNHSMGSQMIQLIPEIVEGERLPLGTEWTGERMKQVSQCDEEDPDDWYHCFAAALDRRRNNKEARCCPSEILSLRSKVMIPENRALGPLRDNKYYQRSAPMLNGLLYNPDGNILFKPNTTSSSRPRKLMIVSHPDDEVIFGGGDLLEKDGTPSKDDWFVIYSTIDPERINMTRVLANRWQWSGTLHFAMADTNLINQLIHVDFVEDLCEILCSNTWDAVVTHGLDGEYGHHFHKKLSKVVSTLMRSLEQHPPQGYTAPRFKQFKLNDHKSTKTKKTKEQRDVLRHVYSRPSKWFAEMCTTSAVLKKYSKLYPIVDFLCK
ncbi:hypothetical protein SARC_12159 [Sphaeroforma arctica JP610]|uniref:N-acetylglucosaminylphosphatidylinositol deacetylase n=1 Tax=Sphaeroforma arctica JP610 TaxID=667725 RepID=A0A0L0FEV9_9EUKA|nr:hypothetical protein SARC_12159 [Sphaeroforma arctica JP610]KNC75312.1 hypothetical protein SARC_12159 [Sphaeroforma arctica JP610]|eukprot:XP_014149214.1 hypothetical protein SARC_12159 [Sphaeroforma arctica JP610]